MKKHIILIFALLFSFVAAEAQYFGQNKPRYRNFDFKVKETDHFSIYSYMKNPDYLKQLATMSEGWYKIHSRIFKDTFDYKNPIIFYNNHADFQQTNAISGSIGIGTGGVTEGLKNRVVLPVTFTNQQTNHVLGHELVHAFQYHKVLSGDSTSLQNLGNFPLWMIEGLAEYMSKGKVDTYTSMWIRDAVVNDDVPSLRDLQNPKYFPYRYGQAFWSFLAGTYGDQVIEPIYMYTAKYGFEIAVDSILGLGIKNLDDQWTNSITNHFEPYVNNVENSYIGNDVISSKNAGNMNVSPSLSPNGRYVIFLSEKDVFTTDLYLADARSGEIIRKINSSIRDSHIDDINYLESSGTWSPNSKEYAFVAFSRGRNILVIKEAETGKTLESIKIPDLPAFTNPNWHPNGREIILTGLVEGQTDLYSFDIKRKKLTQLTNDIYSEIHSDFDAEGNFLVFATDEYSVQNGTTNGKYTFDIAIRDWETGETEVLDVFRGAMNLNPTYDHEGNILFLSDRDGYRNMYKYVVGTGEVLQMTTLKVGISGITEYSPAITASKTRDRVLITSYDNHKYNIFQGQAEKMLNQPVDPSDVSFEAGTLPVVGLNKRDLVNAQLNALDRAISVSNLDTYKNARYKPNFKLDYVGGGTGVAVGNSTFGNYTGLQGGIDMLFGDILGNNQIFVQAALNGEIYDAGGRVTYINRKNKIAWGAGLSHIPLRTGYQSYATENGTIQGIPYNIVQYVNILRVFDDAATVFAHYPFSKNLRLEAGIQMNYRSFRNDLYTNYLQYDGFNAYQIFRDRERIPTDDRIQFDNYFSLVKGWNQSSNIALVGDNSFFGLTSPLKGYRYRIGAEQFSGTDNYYSALADGRYYWWLKPFSFAVRGFAYSRWERNVNSVYPFFIGQMGFVRGYGSILNSNFTAVLDQYNLAAGQVIGTKVLLGSAEIRLPFTGPRRLSLIPSKYLISDLAVFFDAGTTFDSFSHFQDGEEVYVREIDDNGNPIEYIDRRAPAILMSVGVSARINAFGYLIVEPYYALPLREGGSFTFGLNLIPGW